MKHLQFLTDATLTSEDLAGIKGGKRLKTIAITQQALDLLAARGTKSVLYNGVVYTTMIGADGRTCMVKSDTENTCVEW